MAKTKKLLWFSFGAGLSLTIAVGAAILWATPEAEISLRGWMRDLFKLRWAMTKLAKHTAARLWMVILAVLAVGMACEYLERYPPEPNTFLGKAWELVSR